MNMKINKFLVSAYILAVIISVFLVSCCFYPETFQKENQTGENYQTEEAEEVGEGEEAETIEEETIPDEFTGMPSSSVISKIEVPGQAIDVDVSGNYAYLTNDLGVLYIINIKDKKDPKIIGKCPDIDSANIVIVKDSYAYISYTEWENEDNIVFTKCGFKIIDISDMEHPEVIGNYDTSEDNKKSVYGMYVEGDYAYISSSVFGDSKEVSSLEIIDIGDKKNPEMVGSCTVNGSPSSLWAGGNFIYMDINIYDWEKKEYTENSSLKIIDVKDKSNPVVISSVSVLPNCWGIYVKEDFAYISSNTYDEKNEKYTKSMLQVVDIKDPADPKTLGICEIVGGAWEIDSTGNFIYVSSLSGGLYTVDISDCENPTIADSLNTSGASYDITISGNYGYIADGFNGLVIIGLSGESPKKDKHYRENEQFSAAY